MELGERLGYEKFMEYFTAFGLTEKTNVELVGEASSIDFNRVYYSVTSIIGVPEGGR